MKENVALPDLEITIRGASAPAFDVRCLPVSRDA